MASLSAHPSNPNVARPKVRPLARLKKRADFLRVAATRRKWATPGLVLQTGRFEDGGAGIRIGFTASRRVGGAVARNRAKRRLRAAVAHVMPGAAQPGHDYVLIARAATLTRPFDALLRDLETALKRVESRAAAGSDGNRKKQAGHRPRT